MRREPGLFDTVRLLRRLARQWTEALLEKAKQQSDIKRAMTAQVIEEEEDGIRQEQ